jgi:hypothetical protein
MSVRIDPAQFGPLSRPVPFASATRDQADFASILGVAERTLGSAGESPETQARRAAEEFVARVFIEPVLQEARESNTQPPPFGPGPGEKTFASLMDSKRAMDLVRSADWPIVDRLTRDLTRAAESR